ncbi:MAG: hypothetical protein ACI9NY_000108, partial [Kiritimatiellia bacterium]
LFSDSLLGVCPRIENLLQKNHFESIFPIIFVE